MTITLDTHAQDMTRSALTDYAADMATDNETGANDAIDAIRRNRETEKQLIEERDRFIGAMHIEDGLSAPEISRRTGMSISNVRLICDKAKLLHDQQQAHRKP